MTVPSYEVEKYTLVPSTASMLGSPCPRATVVGVPPARPSFMTVPPL